MSHFINSDRSSRVYRGPYRNVVASAICQADLVIDEPAIKTSSFSRVFRGKYRNMDVVIKVLLQQADITSQHTEHMMTKLQQMRIPLI